MNSKELEKTLWAAAKKLRNNSGAYADMHMVLALVFLRYVTDVTDQPKENLVKGKSSPAAVKEENNEEYLAINEYFVPKNAQWDFLKSEATNPVIGQLIDNAVAALEKLNETLREIFPKNYSNPAVDQSALGELIELTGNIGVTTKRNKKKDSLAQLFEYFLEMFAQKDKTETPFYTPPDIARLLVEMAEPRQGKVYDGHCGAGAVLVQNIKFIKKYRGSVNDLILYGQDSNPVLVKIAKMNVIIHGSDAQLRVGNTFTNDFFPDLRADFILACPPFNARDGKAGRLVNDKRWKYGIPPAENANYAWLQHFISKLSPSGTAGIVLPADSLSSSSAEERKIRRTLIEARLVDCIVALPSQLLYNTDMPVCLWLIADNKTNNKHRNSRSEILFIDAGKASAGSNGRKRELTDEMILLISRTYHRWRNINGDYIDLKRFCKTVPIETIGKNGYSLTPQKYTSAPVAKKVFTSVLLIIFLAVLYFTGFKNGLFTSKSRVRDTALTVQPKTVKDSLLSQTKEKKTIKRKEKPAKAIDSAANTVPTIPLSEAPTAENKIPEDTDVKANAPSPTSLADKTASRATAAENNIPEQADVKANAPSTTSLADKTASRATAAENNIPEETKTNPAFSYKVISKAYFYDEPDETTRRRAFISHWNNSYADIRATDEKNGFIYVVFTNHLHQTSKGWLRKKDLKEVNQ